MTEIVGRLFERIKENRVNKGDLLNTPLSKLRTPLLIESVILKDRLYLVANENQGMEIEGEVAYLPKEIRTLLARSLGMDGEESKDYLKKVHTVKRMFLGARIMAGESMGTGRGFQGTFKQGRVFSG
jgi:hypothetical protein